MPLSSHQFALGSRSTTWWMVLALLWVVTALYAWHHLDHGWIPHDEGTLAQSAERVLGGQLPHRDFDEVYTGGLSLLDAAAFRVFGINLFSLRLPLFGLFLLWVPALYYIASRFASPPIAGLVAALGAAWSIPQYSAAMPTWYNLFFATFGTAALLRHLETGRGRWLVAAGLAGGLSILVKIVGLFYVGAVILFLLYRESTLHGPSSRASFRPGPYPIVIWACLTVFVALLVWLVHTQLAVPEVVQFVLPGALLAALVFRESARPQAPAGARAATLLGLLAPFAAGVAIPIAAFLVPYVSSGALPALWHGVFVVPARRLDFAARSLPGTATLLGAVPVALLTGVLPLGRIPAVARRLVLGFLLLALITFLILSRHAVWYSIRPLVPLLVLVGVWLLVRNETGGAISPLRRQQLMLVLAVAA
ncbi:MAG TPA: glycosyltransferase family 39 protein, partial [Gemmatimonadales bacterium]|nr:glycosyltransferase family 39 protein [Gemmatimonadales bacterium]